MKFTSSRICWSVAIPLWRNFKRLSIKICGVANSVSSLSSSVAFLALLFICFFLDYLKIWFSIEILMTKTQSPWMRPIGNNEKGPFSSKEFFFDKFEILNNLSLKWSGNAIFIEIIFGSNNLAFQRFIRCECITNCNWSSFQFELQYHCSLVEIRYPQAIVNQKTEFQCLFFSCLRNHHFDSYM